MLKILTCFPSCQRLAALPVPAAFCLVVLLLATASDSLAATVTNTNDSGPGSLRDAIAITPLEGTVNFALSGCPCTIVLTSGELRIVTSMTITGPGANLLTISGNNASRVFSMYGPASPSSRLRVVMDGITIANGVAGPLPPFIGLSGGGIFNARAGFAW